LTYFQTIVNLAEQGGREGAITQAYREYAIEFNDRDVKCVDPFLYFFYILVLTTTTIPLVTANTTSTRKPKA
jgi:hypothetical protein